MGSTSPQEESPLKGLVFDVKHFAVHDGPGIRTTVFLKGCPLRCGWCHSPESQSPRVEIAYYPDLCISCGACVDACPNGAQTMGPTKIRRELCSGYGGCADACYSGALVKFGERVTVGDVLQEVERDRLLHEASGGGVTLSGGEPAAQPLFASRLLEALKDAGHHTALDTCGHADWEAMEKILGHVDLVLYDLKHMNPQTHEELTGATNKLILSNLRKLSKMSSKKVVVRAPVIPGLNDSAGNVEAMARFLGDLGNIEAVELLPYHNLGVPKYGALGREYALSHLQPPTRERLEEVRGLLEAWGLKVILEGVD